MSMDIRALVLVKTAVEVLEDPIPIAPVSPALLEVAGKSALQRTLERLRRFGIQQITVVTDSDVPPGSANGHARNYLMAARERFWRAAENGFNDIVQEGAELVLLIGLGGYAEVDYEKLVQYHLDQRARVSQVSHENTPLEVFCISASRRNDAASLFRSQLIKCRIECPLLDHVAGYFNALDSARDLRQFAIDILTLKTETQPGGVEIRPGVWLEKGARIEKGARVLAPAFVGAFTKIRTHAVITRCSSVERYAQVDLGTVVENSSILPSCRVGAGLDVAHSVVGAGIFANLRRDAIIEIADPKLVSYRAAAPGQSFLHAALEFTSYLPKQAWRGLFGRSKDKDQQPDLQNALRETSPALGGAAGYQAPACDSGAAEKFPSNLAVVRRYGHQ